MPISLLGVSGLNSSPKSEAAKWGRTPEIQKKAAATAKSAMTDGYIEQVKAMARRDAQKGVYMDKEYIQASLAHMEKYVSPDRSGPIAQVSAELRRAAGGGGSLESLFQLLDQLTGNCTAKIHTGVVGQTAEIYSADGEMIAGYNSLGGGWTTVQTKAESKFLDESKNVYYQAYTEARAEMKAAQASGQPAPSVDFRA